MKKILCLIVCLVLACTTLIACSKETIGDGIGDYPETSQIIERLNINLYIITGDKTTDNAKNSVATRILGHTKTTYTTELKIFYVAASEYEATVNEAINNGGENVPHIVLINSESMFNSLYNAGKLAELTNYYSSRDYGRLNTQITPALLECSKVDSKLYTVPNNRVLGEYEYLVINKEIAMQTLKYGNAELSSYKSLEDAAELIADMENAGYNSSEYVRVVNGPYELRESLSVENFCNIISVPTVTSADAFESAFAIINNEETKYNDRAMQMIYAINNDSELRNFLQYGVLGANYEVDEGGVNRIASGENVYDMNLIYTGNVFMADNCEELNWNESAKGYGNLQNDDCVAAPKE